MFQIDFVCNIFLSFLYRPQKISFLCETFLHGQTFFCVEHPNFFLNFFDVFKYVKNIFCTTGSSAPVSQNIMSNKNFHTFYKEMRNVLPQTLENSNMETRKMEFSRLLLPKKHGMILLKFSIRRSSTVVAVEFLLQSLVHLLSC